MHDKKITNMEQINLCAKLIAQYDSTPFHCESKIQFVARTMELSVQQASRIAGYFDCIPEIQELIRNNIIKLSCTDQIAYKSVDMQKRIYKVLMDANADGIYLSRDRIVVPVAAHLKMYPNLEWNQIKERLRIIEGNKKPSFKVEMNPNSTIAKGLRFVELVVKLMQKNGYPDARVNEKKSFDYKCDAMATDALDRKMVFQMKCHYNGKKEGATAVKEAAEARDNYGADIAVAVTNTEFTSSAKRKAKECGVYTWDEAYLICTLGWNKSICECE